MKIGELAKRANVNITTIRYYIGKGLLVPIKNGNQAQFDFSEEDVHVLEQIAEYKNLGLSIQEIHRALSIHRTSNGVEPEMLQDLKQLFMDKERALQSEFARTQSQLLQVRQKLDWLDSLPAVRRQRIGVPIGAMAYLCCPLCKHAFHYSGIEMNEQYILNGELSCTCGYRANIREGVLYTPNQRVSQFDKPDINRNMYRTMSNQLVTKLQESYNWFLQRLHTSADTVILETHLNCFFFLYKFLDELDENCFSIVSDKFAEIILLYKKYIEKLAHAPQILFIVNNDQCLPLKDGIADYFIDHSSTNENYIYSHAFLLDQVAAYIKPGGTVLSTYFSFPPNSKSIANLRAWYPENHPENYYASLFAHAYPRNYRLLAQKRIGAVTDSGNGITFSFHEKGEPLYIDCYHLCRR